MSRTVKPVKRPKPRTMTKLERAKRAVLKLYPLAWIGPFSGTVYMGGTKIVVLGQGWADAARNTCARAARRKRNG